VEIVGGVLIAMRDEFGMDDRAIGRELRKAIGNMTVKGGCSLKATTPFERYLERRFRQACMWGAANPHLVVETSKVYGDTGVVS